MLSSNRVARLKQVAGLCAIFGLVGLAWATPALTGGGRPGVVVPGQRFGVAALDGGRGQWTLESGKGARGPLVLQQQVVTLERQELVTLSVAPGLEPGAAVGAGQVVASLDSPLMRSQIATLQASLALIDARIALLEAGARPEEIAEARRVLAVARAEQEGTKPELSRAQQLSEAGVLSAVELERTALNARVKALEADLAAAKLAVVSAGARPEERAGLDAERAAVEAKLAEAEARVAAGAIASPIAGELAMSGEAAADGTALTLAVLDLDPVYVRVPMPVAAAEVLAPGAPVRFTALSLGDRSYVGEVVEVAASADVLEGEAVRWVSARLANPDGGLRPGMVGSAQLGEDEPAGFFGTLWSALRGGR